MVVLFTDSPVIYYLLCLCLSSKYKTSRSSNGSVHNGSGYGNRYYQEYRFVGILQIQFYWFHTSFRIGNQAARRHFFPTGSMAAVVFILFIVCCFNQYLWLLTFGLLTIAVLPLAKALHSNNRRYAALKWLGGISAFLFVTHPIVRSCMLGIKQDFPCLSIWGYTFLSILFAWEYKRLLLWCKNRIVFKQRE